MSALTPPPDRYGRRRSPVLAITIVATLALGLFGTWFVWVQQTDPTSGLEWVAFRWSREGTSATVTFQITAPPGTPVSCVLRTIDDGMATNGWVVRDFPGSPDHVTQYSETIRSVSEPAGVDVYRCWRTSS